VITGVARDLTLALLKAIERESVDDLLGLGDPAVTGPLHATAATELE
jgi:hypothetical protein